ncbi:MAG TPA: hypothetical protein VFN13_10665 [Rudaea sp.]|nr:hypothetical protein [Rudaea sp.]
MNIVMPRRWREYLSIVTLMAFVALVFWPGVHGFWGRDDYFLLAFARLLNSPWLLFTNDHYPVPGSVYRPLGYATIWLCERVFGAAYEPNAIADLALHILVGLALYNLMRRCGAVPILAALATLLFSVHPAVIGTALWWSARFDLLAMLFTLVALNAAIEYTTKQRPWSLATALTAILAAMLSKETGVIAVAAISLIWFDWAVTDQKHRARAISAITASWLCLFAFFTWRGYVLGTFLSNVTGSVPLFDSIFKGLSNSWNITTGYITFWQRLDSMQHTVVLLASVTFLVVALSIFVFNRQYFRHQLDRGLIACGLCLTLLPMLVQAPIEAFASKLTHSMSVVEAAMQSRLYYMQLAGIALLLVAFTSPILKLGSNLKRIALLMLIGAVIFVYGHVSRLDAQQFATRSVHISSVARAAVAAISRMPLPKSKCTVFFYGYNPDSEWSKYVSIDSIVKALAPDLQRVAHCWFHSNESTTVYLQAAPTAPLDATPFLPYRVNGKQLPWRRIGDLEFAYLQPPPTFKQEELDSMIFLQIDRGGVIRVRNEDRDHLIDILNSNRK